MRPQGNVWTAVGRGRLLAVLAAMTALTIHAAVAQAPDQVQYLPRDGAAIIVWTGVADATGYNVYQQIVTDPTATPAAGTKVNAEPIKTTSYVVENLKNGTHYHFRVTAIVGGQESEAVGPYPAQGDQGEFVAVVPQAPVLGNHYGHNIGTNYPGSHQVTADGVITLRASGWDIQSDADGFYFLAAPAAGDVTVTARVVSGPTETSDGNGWNLGGVTIRESLDSRARLVMTQVAREGCAQWKRRTEFAESPPDTCSDDFDPTKRPLWVRVVRKGDEFSGYLSADGNDWKQVGETITIPDFPKDAYVGLAQCAHQDGEYSTIVFDNYTVTSP
jgi:hypothetical protein